MSEYAVMPLTDYKGICDKVREKVGSEVVRFEDMGFGYLVSAPFKVEQGKTYTLNMEFTDSNLYSNGYITDSGWADETSPWLFIEQSPYTFTVDFTFEVCIYLRNSKGLTVNDIVSLNIECDGEVVENFVSSTIKSGEMSEKIDAVYEAGQKSEYDRWWDFWQDKGTRTCYHYAFYNVDLKDFYPKYDINIESGQWFMRDARCSTGKLDLVERLKECGVKFSTTNATDVTYLFYQAQISRVPELDFRNKPTGLKGLLFGRNVEIIDKIILPSDGTQHLYSTFRYSNALREVTIEGVIGAHNSGYAFQLQDCPLLTHDSLMSFVNALADVTEDTSGRHFVAQFGSTNLAKLTDEEKTLMEIKGWTYV